jgi:hypothetical protein
MEEAVTDTEAAQDFAFACQLRPKPVLVINIADEAVRSTRRVRLRRRDRD